MQRLTLHLKNSLATTLSFNPENYPYFKSFSVGIASAFCSFFADMWLFEKEHSELPIITFVVTAYCALYYFGNSDETISFKNYKIDYNNSLGHGSFGHVYVLVPRPDNEKGFLSNLFPYAYDYYFPVTNNYTEAKNFDINDSEKYCVKIYKSRVSVQAILENIRDRLEERESNKVLNRHGMTNIKFYASNCLFSQIKTRIHGKTLAWHLTHYSLIHPENYIMRESFISFYRYLAYSSLTFQDMHEKNIMFDERKKRWEIIDGIVEANDQKENIAYKIFSRRLRTVSETSYLEKFDVAIMSYQTHLKKNNIFMLLREFALSNKNYSSTEDARILAQCEEQQCLLYLGRA